jgi:threonine/homoserine efflux transporter RhtA
MQFATTDQRFAFVVGFALVVLGLVLIIAGADLLGIILALIGGVVLLAAIILVQRKAPAVRDEPPQKPPAR